ncbi:MAG: exodeoxyribonuclease VII large subunit [Phycisphaerales bacterium]
MSRLPFDPSKMAAASDGGAPARSALTVSQLGELIDSALKRGIPASVEVVGEIGGFTDRTHWYFDLKDAGAVVNCIMFQFAARRVNFKPRTGQQVKVRGKVDFYAKGGRISLVVDKIEPVGAGALEAQLRAMIEEIRALGWLDPERKRPLPRFPRQIAVITSRTGAALQDVLVTMQKRCPAVGVLLVDARVQGDRAAAEVTAAIRTLSARAEELAIDAILVTRGGGSMEDLWPFNDREMARAIVECSVPVVAAIGHETDTTVAELVADERCATPTQAAMRLTPDRAALERQLDTQSRRLAALLDRAVRTARADLHLSVTRLEGATRARHATAAGALSRLGTRLERCSPASVHARAAANPARLAHRLTAAARSVVTRSDTRLIAHRLEAAMTARLTAARSATSAAARQLNAVSPTAVLERGYSLTFDGAGNLIRKAADVRPGERLRTRLSDGELRSIAEGGASRGDGRRGRAADPSEDPSGLFG